MDGQSLSGLARLVKAGLLGAACLSLAACPRDVLDNIVVNDTGDTIVVTYKLRHPDPLAYPPNECALPQHPGRLSREPKTWARDFGTHRPIAWEVLPGEQIDLETCTLTAPLEPGAALHVATDSWCADDVSEMRATNDPMLKRVPDVVFLSITSAGQTVSHQGWTVAEQFERHKSGHCLLRIRN